MSSPKRPAGRAPAVGDRFQLRIEKLAIGGAGIGRKDGFVLFVPDAAPGDLLDVIVAQIRANHGEAHITRVLEPGPGRRSPPCPYAGDCGGCNWQHLAEEAQREQKQLLVRETLEKFLPGIDVPLESLVPSPRALRYRNRVQPLRRGNRLGYRRRRSHDFLAVEDCLIAEEPLARFFKDVPQGADDVRVELRLDSDGVESAMTDEGGFSFAQVNRFQNEDLIRTVLEWLRDRQPAAIWDLYAGSGNFTFPLANAFAGTPVVGVELNAALARRAREIAGAREDFGFFVSDVASWLRRRVPPPGAVVILDPPRAGAGSEVMTALASSPVSDLIYVACHPVALARDLSTLLKFDNRWHLRRVRAFEMFPQTDHVETIAHVSALV